MTVAPVAQVKDAAAPRRGRHVREQAALVVEDAVRRRRIHVGDDVAALEQREDGAQRRDRLAHVDITGRPKGAAASCARRNPSRSLVPAMLFDNRALTPITTSRWRAMAPRAKPTSARLMSINSPSGALPVREMLTRTRPICGAALAAAPI